MGNTELDDEYKYTINQEAFENINSYIGIYGEAESNTNNGNDQPEENTITE